ncbi:MAG: hypothetical protein K8R74_14245 [Bacteroidales bacterium]|nr:hypothetical protein [Bacteroidales bacterium]
MSNPQGNLLIPVLGNVNQNKSWILKNLPPGIYYWSIQAVDNNFEGSAFAEEESFEIIVSGISDKELAVNSNQPLINSYPNPFTDIITFEITFTGNSFISAYIMDLNGRIVRTLADNRQMDKSALLIWNGENTQGEFLPEGLYYFAFRSGEITESCKVMLIK